MLSLYEILKASKTGIAPDMWTALAGVNWGGKDSGHEVKELTGIPPLSFRADGTPLLDYLISGNMSQIGTPTPTNPIQPQECGERTGNLCNPVPYKINYYINENGVETQFNGFDVYKATAMAQTEYTLSLNTSLSGSTVRIHSYSNGSWVEQIVAPTVQTLPITFTTPQDCDEIRFSITHNALNHIMINTGSTALPYENFGYKIPILSANITTPVYLGEVETTRKIKKYEFTGQETFNKADSTSETGTAVFSIRYDAIGMDDILNYDILMRDIPYPIFYSAHFKMKTNTGDNTPYTDIKNGEMGGNTVGTNTYNRYIIFASNQYTSADDFTTFLQQQYANGTPVTVWYVLATSETAVVNEPLRKIGTYADTLSMEQAGVQIPTNKGNTVIDVETTLKPSEMYIKYQG